MHIGVDLVHIPAFEEQLGRPGSTFDSVFSPLELRVATTKASRGPRGRAEHLAGRWAAKEAFIKAWSQALYGKPAPLAEEHVNWRHIEIAPDRWGRVAYSIAPELDQIVTGSIGGYSAQLSISHDGDYATATCLLLKHQ